MSRAQGDEVEPAKDVLDGLLPAEPPIERVIGWELDVLGSPGMAAAYYPDIVSLIEQSVLQPQRLVEPTIGLDKAAALLPGFDGATVAGMTMGDSVR